MKFWTIILIIAILVQMLVVFIAEHNEDHLKAIYEMLWLFLLIFLLHKEDKSI